LVISLDVHDTAFDILWSWRNKIALSTPMSRSYDQILLKFRLQLVEFLVNELPGTIPKIKCLKWVKVKFQGQGHVSQGQ
jgi:hypothetical protein